jgi:NAD(P)-dependent dehydrogenase (short-subunit alcohol dehydrogenase family)
VDGAKQLSRALVTGGTSGIGRSIVQRLAADDWAVSFTGRDVVRGRAVELATGGTFIQADASDRPAFDAAVVAAAEDGVDLFVAAAALIFKAPLSDTPAEVLSELLEVNLTSAFRASRTCFEAMRRTGGGTIIHVVSDAGIRGLHTIPAYSITKAGLLAVSELYAAFGAPHGIRSIAVCPGATYPGVQSTATGYAHHAEDASTWPRPLASRHGQGADIAAAVAWLASSEAEHVSGAVLRVDGGMGAVMLDRAT